MYCQNCGTQIPAGNISCPGCSNTHNSQNSYQNSKARNFNGNDYTTSFDRDDIETNKILSLFSYIGILFIIPLIAVPNSKYARFHINQGIILCIVNVAYNIITSFIRIPFGWGNIRSLSEFNFWIFSWNPVSLVFNVVGFVFLAAMIYGFYNAVTGKAKEIPIIGKFRILT